MKIGIISQWYPPEPEFIASGLATQLGERGHEVRVLTGFPNYPGGQIYEGYRQRWRCVSEHERVTVRRVPLYPSHDESAVKRVANYLSYAASSTVAALRFLSEVDVLYVYHPPATAYAAAFALRALRRTPAVLHVQDVWPQSVTASAMVPEGLAGKAIHHTLAVAMRQIYSLASSIAVIAPAMADLVAAGGADPKKVRVVLNWTDEQLFRPVAPTPEALVAMGHRGRCTIMHAGNIGPFQNVEGAIRAAAAVKETDLVLVGSGLSAESCRELAASLGAENVRFLGHRSPADMPALYAGAEYQLISLRDLPLLKGSVPSKLPAAFACGAPVIAAAGGDCGEIVARSGAGWACPPEDWQALAATFRQAASTPPAQRTVMAQRARETYLAQMSQQAGVDQLEQMLAEAASAKGIRS